MSQASQSQNSVANFKLVAEKCVSYIINRDSCKIPIKRAALLKFINAFNLIEHNTRNFEAILALTNSTLKEVYGYKLVQIDSKGGTQYIAVLNDDTGPPHEVARNNHGNNALLVLSLIHIYMSGGSLKEDALWRFLEKCGVMNQNDINAKKTLTSVFTKQAYLTYNKVSDFSRFERADFYKVEPLFNRRILADVFFLYDMVDCMELMEQYPYECRFFAPVTNVTIKTT